VFAHSARQRLLTRVTAGSDTLREGKFAAIGCTGAEIRRAPGVRSGRQVSKQVFVLLAVSPFSPPDACSHVCSLLLQDFKVSTFGRALHTAWTKCRQRGGQLHGCVVTFYSIFRCHRRDRRNSICYIHNPITNLQWPRLTPEPGLDRPGRSLIWHTQHATNARDALEGSW
jgi:hypothetical protein